MKTETKYDHSAIEQKWQKKWLEDRIYQPRLDRGQPDLDSAARPYYNLMMFPYPSAEGMHVGNMYAQTGGDIHGRLKRMQGYDVFQPMGLDGFGIHSENYALKVGSHPMDQAEKSEANFYRQMRETGSGFAWENTVETWKEDYYKWTQWVFIQLFKAGLAYRAAVPVNFCPSCKTVLADEQVIDARPPATSSTKDGNTGSYVAGEVGRGRCERCNNEVDKRDLEQWMFRITSYAEQLLEGLDRIDWTEKVKIAQRNWIGKSQGAEIEFQVQNSLPANATHQALQAGEFKIKVFTTRPDTLHGATFLVVSPEHPLVREWINRPEVKEYVDKAKEKSDADRVADKVKTGVFSGAYALNPINNQQLPIWIADYVLMGYGTGAIMAVPAHDERDFEFAKKYDLSIIQVVATQTGQEKPNEERRDGGCAVVFDPASQKYAVATHPDGLLRLFAGGVPDGEDLQAGIMREVTEESGLHDFAHIERIQTTFTHFYNSRKGVNRSALATCYLAILKSTDLVDVHLEEHEQGFQLHWATPEEILENWRNRNADHGLDHWVDFMKASVARAIELGHDTSADSSLFAQSVYKGEGLLINSGDWNGWDSSDREKILADLDKRGIGAAKTTYHLRDWLISRQRYWGPPIPMIYCGSCAKNGKSWFDTDEGKGKAMNSEFRAQSAGWYPSELPVILPRIDDYKPIGDDVKIVDGKAVTSPLGNHPEFYEVTCPECNGQARRETDVSDTFLDSSWYFYRYFSTDDKTCAWDPARAKDWMPVTIYTGGAEHSVLHLLYSRFLTKAFKDIGLISHFDEPFPRFFAHGLIVKDGSKMSKSKGNVIVPDAYIKKFGADTLRTYLMFLGPFDAGGDFRDSGIEGMNRFMKRVWTLLSGQIIPGTVTDKSASLASDESRRAISLMHKTIQGVTEDLETFHYNTAIAKIMTYYNFLSKKGEVHSDEAEALLKLLAPFAPHMTEELYQQIVDQHMAGKQSIHTSAWPKVDPKLIEAGEIVVAVQVNGKLRATFEIESTTLSQKEVEEIAGQQESIKKHLEGKSVKKIIYVPGKILNFVVS